MENIVGSNRYPWLQTYDSNSLHWLNRETTKTGGDTAHNNLSPYVSIYIFKRIS